MKFSQIISTMLMNMVETGLIEEEYNAKKQTKYPPVVTPPKVQSNRVIYRPVESSYDNYKYVESSTTPNYYVNHRNTELPTVGKIISRIRQFVVGSVPQEYANKEIDKRSDAINLPDLVAY